MKPSTLLVAGSLAVNAALFAVYYSRAHSAAPTSSADSGGAAATTPDGAAKKGSAGKSPLGAIPGLAPAKETWTKLNNGDLHALAARLRAAGFPPSVVRSVVAAQINESFKSRREQLAPATNDKPFWETSTSGTFFPAGYDAKTYAALRDLSREQAKLLKEILGDDATAGNTAVSDNQRRRYGDLPPDKLDQLQRLEQDYNDLRSEISRASLGITLPEDREKMTILEQEKRADLAALLSPQEMEDYLMRSSTTTSRLRTALTAMNATDAEFRAIYQAQSAYDEKYTGALGLSGMITADIMKDRQAEQAATTAQIKAALGDERFAEYSRASDREYQQLNRMAQQAGVPEATAIQVYNLRESTLKESGRIYDDPTLTPEQKRASLQALGQSARTEISATLGADVGNRYLQVASRWLAGLDRGAAVTFNESGGMQTRAIPPPRPVTTPSARPNVAP